MAAKKNNVYKSTIYKNTAQKCLMRWHANMKKIDREKIVECEPIEEIENYVKAKDPVEIGAEAIMASLEREGVELPKNFATSIVHDDKIIQTCKKRIEKAGLSDRAKARVTLSVLNRLHEWWRFENFAKFFDKKRREQRFMFLPLEMIGFEEAKKDYIFAEETLKTLGLRCGEEQLHSMYLAMQKKYLRDHSMTFISGGLFGMVAEKLANNYVGLKIPDIEAITEQVIEHNPEMFAMM